MPRVVESSILACEHDSYRMRSTQGPPYGEDKVRSDRYFTTNFF